MLTFPAKGIGMRLAFTISCIVAVLACTSSRAEPRSESSKKALEILQKTKSTRATYAVYNRDHVGFPGGKSFVGTSAEFHSGTLHRVETSLGNVIADCEKKFGWSVEFNTGKRSEGEQVANSACGINTNFELNSAEWLGAFDTSFGRVDRIQVRDDDNVRTYDVLHNGALLRATYEPLAEGGAQVWQETLAVSDRLPSHRMFDPSTLEESFIPADYQQLGE